jgi:uncharacterized protein
MQVSRYIKIYPAFDDPDRVLIYSTLRGAVLQVSRAVAEALLDGTLEGEERETMARFGVLVPDALAEQRQVAGYFDWANANARHFTALVTLNLDCNLACPYCYEGHFRGKSYMSEATADLLVETILDGPIKAGREVLLDFYGGEALLSIPLIRRIAGPLRQAAGAAGTKFSFNLVTNGTLLTRPVVEELLPLGLVGAKVTIDGPPDIHNRQRPFVSGQGSFDAILKNLGKVCDLFKLQLGGNFTRDNYRRFPELLDLLAAAGITPDRLYMVTFSPVTPTAGEAGLGDFAMGCACTSEAWLIEASLHLREEILKRGWNTPKPKLTGCMVEFENDLIVGWDGALYKCPAFMGWDDLKIGTLADGIGDYRESHNLDVWKNDECLECPYLPLCFGGCRFLRRLRTGAIDGIDCRKQYFDEALERIVRQDIELRKRST